MVRLRAWLWDPHKGFKGQAGNNLGHHPLTDRVHYLGPVGAHGLGWMLQGADRVEGSALQGEARGDLAVAADMRQGAAETAQHQAAVDADGQHAEALFEPLVEVFVVRGHHPAVLARGADGVLGIEDHPGYARPFPLARRPCGGRVVGRAEKEDLHPFHLEQLVNVAASLHRLDDGHDKHVLFGFLDVLRKALPPASGALGADAAQSLGRIVGKRDGLAQLLDLLHPGHHHSVGADVEGAFDQPYAEFGDAHQHHRVAAHGGAEVLEDVAPVEVAVLGVDHDPVEAQSHAHLGNAGRLQGDPETVDRFVAGQFLSHFANGGAFHFTSNGLWRQDEQAKSRANQVLCPFLLNTMKVG